MRKLVAIIMIIGTVSCVREPEQADLVKHMVVQTEYDTAQVSNDVFSDYSTFVLRQDTLGYISTLSNDTILLENPGNRPIPIDFVLSTINEVESQTVARGFTRVEEDENPDFGIKIVVLENFSFYQTVSYPGYYSGYYGYYGGYYGPIVNTYSSNFITLVIEVVDIRNFTANNNRYIVIWSAYIGDLLSTVDRKNNIIKAVDQAFVQSPYFVKN